MRNFIIAMCILPGAFLMASCNSDKTNGQEATEAVATTGEPVIGGDSVLTNEHKELFDHIARHNLFSVTLGRIAAQRGASEDVKQYGQQQVDWYTSKQQELNEMARTYQVKIEQDVYKDYQDDVDEVTNAKQENFDEEYWENVIDAQKELLDKYEGVIDEADEAEHASAFSIWARSSMKELRAQMEQAMTFDKRRRDRI